MEYLCMSTPMCFRLSMLNVLLIHAQNVLDLSGGFRKDLHQSAVFRLFVSPFAFLLPFCLCFSSFRLFHFDPSPSFFPVSPFSFSFVSHVWSRVEQGWTKIGPKSCSSPTSWQDPSVSWDSHVTIVSRWQDISILWDSHVMMASHFSIMRFSLLRLWWLFSSEI